MKIKKMTDEQCLKLFIDLLEDRVTLNTGFVKDDDGNLTHQLLQIECGEFASVSAPEPLEVVLRPATAAEQGATLN